MDEEISDDDIGNPVPGPECKLRLMQDFHANTIRRLFERSKPRAFPWSLPSMMKYAIPGAVDDLLGRPGDRNAGTPCRHDNDIAIGAAFQVPNITMVRQEFRPQL